jgi:hypothetical protein
VKRDPPLPPHPDLLRSPPRGFGWLDDRLLREHWLALLGPEPIAVLVFLALAADRRGASFYRRDSMRRELSMPIDLIDQSLHRLLDLGLVAHRPWSRDSLDGVWQLLPLPPRPRG